MMLAWSRSGLLGDIRVSLGGPINVIIFPGVDAAAAAAKLSAKKGDCCCCCCC